MPEDTKSKKPSNSAFKQQRLKAWQPILTPQSVLPTFFIIGLIFVPVGVGLFVTANRVQEYVVDYTQCEEYSTPKDFDVDGTVYTLRAINDVTCSIDITVADLPGPVFLYYRLTNFYQNHRRYVKSYDAKQLQGNLRTETDLSSCDPLITGIDPVDGLTKPIYPCGLIANSLFNDTFSPMVSTTGGTSYTWLTTGIAWPSDKNKYGATAYNSSDVVPPPNWAKYNGSYQLGDDLSTFDIENDEAFMVWMRTAGLPTFRKLWGRLEGDIASDTYNIVVDNRYPVSKFGGTKSLVISTTSWLGGKNLFLGIAYIVVGCICILLGLVFLVRHVLRPRKLGDPSYLSWNKTK